MAKIIFYTQGPKSHLNLFEYYKQDIDALKALGHDVLICSRYSEIPFKFDLIFVWWWTFAFYPVLLGKVLGKPVIITGTFNFRVPKDFSGTDYFARPFWQRILISFSTRMATLNLFVNKSELNECRKYFKLNSARFYPHVISNDYLCNSAIEREMSLFNISWSGKKNLVRKGIPELIEAIYLLNQEGLNIKLVLAGESGDGYNYLKELIDKFKINENVKLVGKVTREEKIKLLTIHEVYVQPSHYEGFGLAMAEAMAASACIITCDVGAVKDVVSDCGIYVTPGSAVDLAKKIKIVFEDKELRECFQKKAFDRASKEFSFSKKLTTLKSLLSEAGVN